MILIKGFLVLLCIVFCFYLLMATIYCIMETKIGVIIFGALIGLAICYGLGLAVS